MSDHTTALVPLEAWAFHSPDVRNAGRLMDVGLFAESLIYYDRVLVIPTTESDFAAFIEWFVLRGRFDDLIGLINEGAVGFYYYAFQSAAVVLADGTAAFLNIQDQQSATLPVFESRVLDSMTLRSALRSAKQRSKLKRALEGRVSEIKAADIAPFARIAEADAKSPKLLERTLQAFADDAAAIHGLTTPPEISATVTTQREGRTQLLWTPSFDALNDGLAPGAQLSHATVPLTALFHANRLVWSASNINSDL